MTMARRHAFKLDFVALQQLVMAVRLRIRAWRRIWSPMSASPASSAPKKELGFVEFVCIVALMMALNALAIDAMLPALPHIAEDLGLVNDNDR